MSVTIYHSPSCSNSRGALQIIRDAGIEPTIIEYLKTPPTRAELADLVARAGITARALMRAKEPEAAEFGLNDPAASEAQILDAMAAHPRLINRPLVVTPKGVRLCRPPELVRDLLPGS